MHYGLDSFLLGFHFKIFDRLWWPVPNLVSLPLLLLDYLTTSSFYGLEAFKIAVERWLTGKAS